MALGEPVRVRLSEALQPVFEDEAARRGESLSTYLRKRLEDGAESVMDLAELRRELATLGRELATVRRQLEAQVREMPAPAPDPTPSSLPVDNDALVPMLAELLLLMRDLAGAERIRRAQSELRRQGMPHWGS